MGIRSTDHELKSRPPLQGSKCQVRHDGMIPDAHALRAHVAHVRFSFMLTLNYPPLRSVVD
eukprot:CAMPEP_0169353860 /NCGR_PEP_ID=MMETSP1017-20121227/26123_1 /TAXON_ID=342587 /ORGANISM="Karlodinium micrum, Strain CCMP2283" /LENGTH=60 /DNA_ID=CAMNT_0009450387 /DNA_START=200 /DNA_END=382 /DNA_ORIENTATION=-